LSVLDQRDTEGWDEVYASQTFHEVTMYYPMRMVRTRRYKLIYNIAWPLEFPLAKDLWKSKTWKAMLERKDKYFGKRTTESYLHRPKFELYDLKNDPDEVNNLADSPQYAKILEELKQKLRKFQQITEDPWVVKWERE